jgi:Rad3-related DNA helicase
MQDNWMSHFEQIVLDEGHDAPDALASAMSFVLTDQDVDKVLGLRVPLSPESIGCWKVWAAGALEVAQQKVKEWEYLLEEESSAKTSWIKQYLHVKRVLKRVRVLATCQPINWVVDEVEEGFQFDPIRPGQYSEGILFLRLPRIIIVSATLRPKTMYMLGVGQSSYDFHEFDSGFDPRRCPIYWIPTMRVDVRAKDLSQLWVRLDQIMARRRDRKGIIHTHSYDRRDSLINKSRFASSIITNQRGESIMHVIDSFRRAGPGTVLASPSVSTGFDFPMKDCEWQFLCKIPFPDGRAKIQQARQEADREYGPYSAMQTLVQSFGRGMRSKEDQCEGLIADDHLEWFLPKFRHLAPKSFHAHFKKVEVVPSPPKALEA